MPTNASLYESESYLSAMLDTEDGGISPEMEEQFALELREAVGAAVDKRERVGQFILHCESQAEFCRKEVQRITKRARVFENVAERVRNYVRDWICAQPLDAKGKRVKLQGHTLAMSTRACPASLEITDAAKIPSDYLNISITLPHRVWMGLLQAAGGYAPKELSTIDRNVTVDRTAVKKAIEGGAEVPGADLVTGNVSLVVK